jgi:sugar phosphate isomerase/epimerase
MKTLPIGAAIGCCAHIGYDCVELCLIKDFPTEIAKFTSPLQHEVRARLADAGLQLPSMLLSLDLSAPDQTSAVQEILAAGEIARRLNDQNPPIVETVTQGKSKDWDRTHSQLAANLHGWAVAAATSGIRIAIRPGYGHVVDRPERLIELYQRVHHPALTLAYDYCPFQAAGLGLEPTLHSLIAYTGFIQVKDIVPGSTPPVFLLPGEGGTDYVKYFRLLREYRYTGAVVVEVSAQIHRKPGYDPIQSAKKSYALSEARERSSFT